MRLRLPLTLLLLTLAVPVGGCGSKISEANYYRVHYGMTEDTVEDLLGPAHHETSEPPATSPADGAPAPAPATLPATQSSSTRKVKIWARDALTIRVTFEDGKVVHRSAGGIPAEAVTPTGPLAARPLSNS